MQLENFLNLLASNPETIHFSDTLAIIEKHYQFTPTGFQNGDLRSEAGQNSGSCKIFSFAKIYKLSESQTLACFGDYYRKDVLEHPEANDHQNIRNFIKYGWNGIQFDGNALKALSPEE